MKGKTTRKMAREIDYGAEHFLLNYRDIKDSKAWLVIRFTRKTLKVKLHCSICLTAFEYCVVSQ